MLEIKDLKAGYGELKVLKGINIEVKANEIVALIGPNGAGKSTVIKSVFSIAKKMGGKIFFRDRDITKLKTHQLMEEGISYVNQGQIIFSTLTVLENLEIGAELIKDKAVIQKNLEAVYAKFPILKQKKYEYAFTLSGGQRQQLALGRALMQSPSLLLLDEPSLGLSPKLQKELFKTIAALRDDGISILIVEQNAKKAIEMADRTYLLEQGEIALKGGREILKNKKIQQIYLGGHY
ncbi:MAG: ABC transporter ATP-binding protein [Candidatus Nanoarchaeia archaeon]